MGTGKKKPKKGGGAAPPIPGTTIIIRPGGGNQISFDINGGAVAGVHAGTNLLNYRAFTTVLWARADVKIGNTTYQNVSCRRLRVNLTVGGVAKQFQFEVVDGAPSWWLDGVEYVPDDSYATRDWNADLVNALTTSAFNTSVRVQPYPANPDWVDYPAEAIEIAFV